MNEWRRYLRYGPYAFVALLALACAGIWSAVYAQMPRGVLTFAVLNIGQGDGLYIESPAGEQVLFDAGPNDGSVLRELPKVMPPFDRSIDLLIESHADADHIGGFIDVLNRYQVGAYMETGMAKNTSTFKTLETELAGLNIPHYLTQRGMVVDLGGGAYLQILFPDRDVSNLSANASNEGSTVAHLIYGSTSVMLTGDAPMDIENHLIALDGAGLQSDILKVGHHGSRFSTGSPFVAAVHPLFALISVGAHNTYGHPTKQVLDTLAAANVPVLRTDQDGTLIFKSDGTHFWRVQ